MLLNSKQKVSVLLIAIQVKKKQESKYKSKTINSHYKTFACSVMDQYHIFIRINYNEKNKNFTSKTNRI
jgi:hypothetical protein